VTAPFPGASPCYGGLTESLLIITGTMGAGKTAVLGEASDILAQRRIVHAAIDLDALGVAHLPAAIPTDDVMYDNLGSVCSNYATQGVQRFLVARAMEDAGRVKLCREMIPAVNTVVCRLTANLETMERRVQQRDSGMFQRELVARVAILNAILDRARLEDFAVANENRSLTEVAIEMLGKAGWIAE
jgi:phosphosulfolactate synthase (CoM biosynthesis protein A)